jgi:TIR domain-containing protein
MDPETVPRFQVALSFAGEQRSFVSQVAERLKTALGPGHVFYDRDYEAELARPDLDLYLQQIYLDSRLLVVFLGTDYERKEWCGLEWRVVRNLIKEKSAERIMLIRFDDAPISGLLGIDGSVEARDRDPAEIADLILERLTLLEGTKRTAAETPRPRRWPVWLIVAVLACLAILGGRFFLARRSHVLLLVPGKGIFEPLPRVSDPAPGPGDTAYDLRINKGHTSHDLRRQPIYLGAPDQLAAAVDQDRGARWVAAVEACSGRSLTAGEKQILTAISEETPLPIETARLSEKGTVEVEILRLQDGESQRVLWRSFTIDARHCPQPIFLKVEPTETETQSEVP